MLLTELEFDVTFIHSQLNQRKRLNNLGRFKSQLTKILVATDVASRGLDIPQVQLVINFDVPKDPRDYVHRVGRTARAGRGGQAITIMTQYDIQLILAAEKFIGAQLQKIEYDEKEALDDINHQIKVMQVVRIKMNEQGINDMFDDFKDKKLKNRERMGLALPKHEQTFDSKTGSKQTLV